MPHYKTFFDTDYIGSWDLPEDRDRVAVIERIEGARVKNQRGEEDAKLVVHLRKWPKPLLCNVTNASTIAKMYGTNTDAWIDKPIAMYVAEINAFGEVRPCIRIRPTIPKPPRSASPSSEGGAGAPAS